MIQAFTQKLATRIKISSEKELIHRWIHLSIFQIYFLKFKF